MINRLHINQKKPQQCSGTTSRKGCPEHCFSTRVTRHEFKCVLHFKQQFIKCGNSRPLSPPRPPLLTSHCQHLYLYTPRTLHACLTALLLRSSSLCNFLHHLITSCLFGPNTLLTISFWNTLIRYRLNRHARLRKIRWAELTAVSVSKAITSRISSVSANLVTGLVYQTIFHTWNKSWPFA
jgi:hypothetical protein